MFSKNSVALCILIFLVTIQSGHAWSIWKWLGLAKDVEVEPSAEKRHFDAKYKYKDKHYPSKYHDDQYETYYVEVPQNDWDEYKETFGQDEGVKVWEFPSLWDGSIVVPNFYALRRETENIIGGPVEDDRVVQGLDNRVGIRLAVPFIGDFQYVRETGPGDFVPELGPGKFFYPGPGDVNAVGGLAIRGEPDQEVAPPPVIDLTGFEGLQNYPWFTR